MHMGKETIKAEAAGLCWKLPNLLELFGIIEFETRNACSSFLLTGVNFQY
jgi:hypothetical protein